MCNIFYWEIHVHKHDISNELILEEKKTVSSQQTPELLTILIYRIIGDTDYRRERAHPAIAKRAK